MLGLKEFIASPAEGEEIIEENAGPSGTVLSLSAAKAAEVADRFSPDDIIIAADTIVWANGRKLGKPHSEEEAKEMLRMLSGYTHEVYTGITVRRGSCIMSEYEMSEVVFRKLSESEIISYVATGEPMDKAGAYGIQGMASLFVERINGDYYNIMGLPLCHLGEMLKKQGVNLL